MNLHYDQMLDVTLDTQIVDEKDGYYAFADTVFYGEKGGMPSDKGTINGIPVTDLKWEGEVLYHEVDNGNTPLTDPIHMEVDPFNRWINTSLQSALHLLDGYYRRLDLKVTAVGVDPHNQWYEVNNKDVDETHLKAIQDYVEQAILEDIPSSFEYFKGSEYPDEFYSQFDQVRVVSFGDLDRQPCGTPHVTSTAQIGSFAVLGSEKTSRGTRVHITAGPITAHTLIAKQKQLEEIRQLLNTNEEELVSKTKDLLSENKESAKEIKELKQELLQFKMKELAEMEEDILIDAVEASQLRSAAQALVQMIDQTKVLLAVHGEVINFAMASPDGKARDLLASLREKINMNGGGSPQIVSGRTTESLEALVEAIEVVI